MRPARRSSNVAATRAASRWSRNVVAPGTPARARAADRQQQRVAVERFARREADAPRGGRDGLDGAAAERRLPAMTAERRSWLRAVRVWR